MKQKVIKEEENTVWYDWQQANGELKLPFVQARQKRNA